MLNVERKSIRFNPDPTRVILKSFIPGEERVEKIFNRIMSLTNEEIDKELDWVLKDFEHRHKNYKEILLENYTKAVSHLGREVHVSDNRRLLIGATFTMEYSIESAAFFNPSIVLHDDQSMCKDGESHIVISFRATGEGHISSIAFRTGFIDKDNNIRINDVVRYVGTAKLVEDKNYNKITFQKKLKEMDEYNYVAEKTLRKLPRRFTMDELVNAIDELCDKQLASEETRSTFEVMMDLARANYEITFDDKTHLCERVIFPVSHAERKGVEDARFVRYVHGDGDITYYATYTAYNGRRFIPQLLATKNFIHYKIRTLNGTEVQNKGMALFPRRVGGMFMMLSRQDNENLYIMSSDNINFWENAELLYSPTESWEIVQIGNCGSPIETDEGWIVLTHGVGPMRQYALGAILLDLEDPYQVIGRLREPLMFPNEEEREGYVPNVVYSCGAMLHNDSLIIPYAMSDSCSSVAVVGVRELIDEMKKTPGEKS